MGEEDKAAERIALLTPYQINAELTRKRREFDLPTVENYTEFDYEAYYEEHYKVETGNGGHIFGTADGEVFPTLEQQQAGNVQK